MTAQEHSFFITGGTLRYDSPSYVERQADRDLFEGLTEGDFCYVLTSRQMGKSSLMVRAAQRLRENGVAVSALDLTAIGQNINPEQWYDGLILRLGRQLHVEEEIEAFWQRHDRISAVQRFFTTIREVVLDPARTQKTLPTQLVIFVDEIDAVRSLPFSTDEFFAAIRECYNCRSEDAVLNRLTFCLLGVATPSELIRDARTTPFNIGRRIELDDFTSDEAAPLAQGLRAQLFNQRGESNAPFDTAEALLERILYWTNGHPYLTQRLCRAVIEVVQGKADSQFHADGQASHARGLASDAVSALVDRICEELFLSERARERDDNLLYVRERMLRSEVDLAVLLNLYDEIRNGRPVRDQDGDPIRDNLRLAGIARVVNGRLEVRNRVYSRVFDADWIRAHLPKPSMAARKSIAVLPFVNMSSDPENEFLSDGITEDLIAGLSQIKGLRVPARSSAFVFKDRTASLRQVGDKLGVTTVLEGSVRKSGAKLRITVQLINVQDGACLWSEKYQREMADVFAIQDEITQAIVGALKVQLLGDGEPPTVRRYTENLEAYNLYLKGRYFWNRRGEGLRKGMYYFELALLEDPNYALAYTGLADSFTLLGFYGYLPPLEAFPKAKAAALKALAIDDSLAEAHNSMAFLHFLFDWDNATAEKEFQKAIDLNPAYVPARCWYASCLLAMGRNDEGVCEAQQALEIDPLSVFANTHLGWTLLLARRYDAAIAQLNRTLEFEPNVLVPHWLLGQAFVQSGAFEPAFAAFEKAIQLSGSNAWILAWLGYAYGIAGQTDQARKVLDQLTERSKMTHVRSFFFALVCTGLGDNDKAFMWLEKAWHERDFWLQWLAMDATFDKLRSDPRFQLLVQKVAIAPAV